MIGLAHATGEPGSRTHVVHEGPHLIRCAKTHADRQLPGQLLGFHGALQEGGQQPPTFKKQVDQRLVDHRKRRLLSQQERKPLVQAAEDQHAHFRRGQEDAFTHIPEAAAIVGQQQLLFPVALFQFQAVAVPAGNSMSSGQSFQYLRQAGRVQGAPVGVLLAVFLQLVDPSCLGRVGCLLGHQSQEIPRSRVRRGIRVEQEEDALPGRQRCQSLEVDPDAIARLADSAVGRGELAHAAADAALHVEDGQPAVRPAQGVESVNAGRRRG